MRLNSKGRLHRAAAVGAVATLASVAAGCGSSSKSSTSTSGGAKPATSSVSGTISMDGVWSGAEQQAFQDVIKTFNQQYPKVTVNYKSTGDNLPTVLSTASRAAIRPTWRTSPSPVCPAVRRPRARSSRSPTRRPSYAANFAPAWVTLGTFNGKLYGLVFKASNKSTVWYNVARVQDRRRQPADDVAAVAHGRQHAEGVGHARVLDRRRRRLDAHRPVREHLPPPGRACRSTGCSRRTRSSGPIPSVKAALKTMA